MSNVNIHFYGERGIINGIILDIQNSKERTNKFFNSIRLLGAEPLPWADGVQNCQWIVEPSFAQFGNPDCIAIFESAGKKYALFFEAKLKDYKSSCFSYGADTPKESFIGQSSKLNVQLSFRYRFVKALKSREKSGNAFPEIIEEGNDYPDGFRRKLNKPTVINFVDVFLGKVAIDNFYYIALTNDKLEKDTPFELDPDLLPPLIKKGKKHLDTNWKLFGLLTYRDLIAAGVIDRESGYFGTARSMMNLEPDIIPSKTAPQSAATAINGTKLDQWGDRKTWAEQLTLDKRLRFVELTGSYSAKANGEVVMKLMASHDSKNELMIGMLEQRGIDKDCAKGLTPYKYRVQNKEFLFYYFTKEQVPQIHQLALLYMDSFFAENRNFGDSTNNEAQ